MRKQKGDKKGMETDSPGNLIPLESSPGFYCREGNEGRNRGDTGLEAQAEEAVGLSCEGPCMLCP